MGLSEVDWTEPWLLALLAFHLVCLGLALRLRTNPSRAALFLLLAALAYSAERLNEQAALHWTSFAGQQYFDHGGFFIAMVLCLPILLNLLVITATVMWTAGRMLVAVKRAELRAKKDS